MDFYQVLENRRTIRDFSDREVSDESLKKVLNAAFKAPTNDHLRQLEFVVVRGQEITLCVPWDNTWSPSEEKRESQIPGTSRR